ncbi:AmpG family muropeptide MFS transporter [Marinibactrum halimedae]|uniref:MFS transporter n=1 Tax=Marinibactrum halimedae TaxID=1444977 RepID=A0AA37TB22_9GAMM|nr:MFS transporter [Marinibactrum halimedae]MCD9460348.1 MFS transporter [Marinibactrum halimedae]GLS26785.1 MFS transporter [Marinibactrum halimedae]
MTSNWIQALKVYWHRKVLVMWFLGFSAGLPLLLVFSTLTAWLSDYGVSKTAIGFFAWVGITYSVKVFWSPIVDRLHIPFLGTFLGRRRSWILVAQLFIAVSLALMSQANPESDLMLIALLALAVAFSSATQDLSIDAYRVEAATVDLQAAMSATYVFGYRLAMLVAGAGAFFIADWFSWSIAYLSMALFMGVGVVTVLVIKEPLKMRATEEDAAHRLLEKRFNLTVEEQEMHRWQRFKVWFGDAVICPFLDFFQRNGTWAIFILIFIGVFRLSDITMGIMANPFYLDVGFTKSEIATVGKIYGFGMTMFGTFVAGIVVAKIGVFRPLFIAAIMVVATNILFAYLAYTGPSLLWLTIVISADNLSGGLANACFIAYLAGLTNRHYTATQYALFSSLMTLPGKFLSGFGGVVVDSLGFVPFFLYAAVIGIPAILMSAYLMKTEKAYYLFQKENHKDVV